MKNLANSHALNGASTRSERQTLKKRSQMHTVTLIYVPMHFGGCHLGASMGPAAMRVAQLERELVGMGVKVAQEIDIPVPRNILSSGERRGSEPKYLPEVLQVSEHVSSAVEAALEQGTIPITIGGDHSLAIGSLAGVANYYRKRAEQFGLLWFDAHGDINTPETSPSGNIHGMPVAIALGNGDSRLTGLRGFAPKVDARHAALIGTRDLDTSEPLHIQEASLAAYTMRDIDKLGMAHVVESALDSIAHEVSGLHVSFDLDVMDPDVAPGVCLPARGGLSYREALSALTLLAETGLVGSIDMVELNPAGDLRNKSAELAVDLLKAILGHRIL